VAAVAYGQTRAALAAGITRVGDRSGHGRDVSASLRRENWTRRRGRLSGMPAHARKPRGVRDVARAALRAGRGWRRSRPFWGALITMAGGAEIAAVRLSLPVHSPRTIIPAGVLIAGAIVACGLLLLFDPVQRSVYATTAILLAISALTTSHLGGYLVGTVLGGAGGATAFAWVPSKDPATSELSTQSGPQGFTLILGEADGWPDRSSGPEADLCRGEPASTSVRA
jgi:Family of unknown function (DUF6114)